MTSYMGEDLGLEPQIAYDFAVLARLLRGCRRSELNIFNSKGVQCFRYLNFGFGVEEGIGKLCEQVQYLFHDVA